MNNINALVQFNPKLVGLYYWFISDFEKNLVLLINSKILGFKLVNIAPILHLRYLNVEFTFTKNSVFWILRHAARWKSTDISGEHVTSIFRVEE
jgi:hypothetical protein